jgi:hypothetical protein
MVEGEIQKLIIAFEADAVSVGIALLRSWVVALPWTDAVRAVPDPTEVALSCDILLGGVLLRTEGAFRSFAGESGDVD